MTNEQIIKKSIERALKNGYIHTQRSFDFLASIDRGILNDYYIREDLYYPIIFSHPFAKAFFGTEELSEGKTLDETYEEYKEHYLDKDDFEFDWITEFKPEEAWAYHLKQMVLEKEPLRYLERFL